MNRTITNVFRALLGRRFRTAFLLLAVLGMLFAASGAKAGCAVPYKAGAAPAIPFISHNSDGESKEQEHGTIVGLWHVIYTGETDTNFPPGGPFPPTPFLFAETFKTWHGDGTEFENAFLPPSGGNICFGVWKDLGHRSVKLHHIGLMFAPDGKISHIFTVDETDTVASDGKTYEGTFDFKLFDPTNVFGTGPASAEVTGTTAGTRITVD